MAIPRVASAALYANAPLLLSIAVQSLPVVGDAYSALTGFIGYDPIAGVALSEVERAAAIASAFVIGGGFHLLGRLAGAVPDAARLGRTADNLADVGVGARLQEGLRSVSRRASNLRQEIFGGSRLSQQGSVRLGRVLDAEPGAPTRFYRGATSGTQPTFTPRPGEFRVDPDTGFVKQTHGVSVFDNRESVARNGFVPHELDLATVPPELRIIQRGRDPHHFEIVPAIDAKLTLDQFTDLLCQIQCRS